MVGVEDRAGRGDVGVVVGLDAPGQLEDRVEPGADVARLGVLVAAALELADLAQGRLADVVGQVGLLDAFAVVLGVLGLVVAELLADRRELLAQDELALVLVDALLDRLGDLLVDVGLGEVVAGPADQQCQALGDIGRLQKLTLLLVVEVGRVARGVGQLAGVGEALDRVDDLPGVALLQDRDEQALVVAGQVEDGLGRLDVLDQLGLDPQGRAGAGDAALDVGALLGAQHCTRLAAGEAAELLDRRDDAVGRVTVLEAGRHQEAVVIAGAGRVDGGRCGVVELDRDDHAGQDDDVRQGEDGELLQCAHESLLRVESDGLNHDRSPVIPTVPACSLWADAAGPRAVGFP